MSLFLHFQVYLGYNELVRNAFLLKIAFLAQLVEQWTLNPWVAGSSPAGGILKKTLHLGVEHFLLFFCQFFAKTTHNFLDFIIASVQCLPKYMTISFSDLSTVFMSYLFNNNFNVYALGE